MQTRKKVSGRNASREHASPRVSRIQKKYTENADPEERKVSELITSSARKTRAGSLHKKNEMPIAAKGSNRRHDTLHEETVDDFLNVEAVTDGSLGCKTKEDPGDGTIFSPSFHLTRSGPGDSLKGVDSITQYDSNLEISRHNTIQQMQEIKMNGQISHYSEYVSLEEKISERNKTTSVDRICSSFMDIEEDMSSKNLDTSYSDMIVSHDSDALAQSNLELHGVKLSPEVSAIYLAMKNSKLECVDEHGQDTIADDVHAEDEEYDEFDDFDPYLFIKNLPDLTSVVPTFRPLLLPKQTRSCPSTSLVLDLDETLVHSSLEPCDDADFTFPVNFNQEEHTVYVRCRPYLKDFMERVSTMFEIIIFTASQSIYAEQLLNILDPKRRIFRHRVYRDSCVFVEGNYLKDLSILGRDLARVVIVDNSPQAFGFQVDNGIPIESWFEDRSDQELLLLLPFLESLVGVEDVRPIIARKFSLREKIAAADCALNSSRVDPF